MTHLECGECLNVPTLQYPTVIVSGECCFCDRSRWIHYIARYIDSEGSNTRDCNLLYVPGGNNADCYIVILLYWKNVGDTHTHTHTQREIKRATFRELMPHEQKKSNCISRVNCACIFKLYGPVSLSPSLSLSIYIYGYIVKRIENLL